VRTVLGVISARLPRLVQVDLGAVAGRQMSSLGRSA